MLSAVEGTGVESTEMDISQHSAFITAQRIAASEILPGLQMQKVIPAVDQPEALQEDGKFAYWNFLYELTNERGEAQGLLKLCYEWEHEGDEEIHLLEIVHLWIDPNLRGQGIARRLTQRLAQMGEELGFSALQLMATGTGSYAWPRLGWSLDYSDADLVFKHLDLWRQNIEQAAQLGLIDADQAAVARAAIAAADQGEWIDMQQLTHLDELINDPRQIDAYKTWIKRNIIEPASLANELAPMATLSQVLLAGSSLPLAIGHNQFGRFARPRPQLDQKTPAPAAQSPSSGSVEIS